MPSGRTGQTAAALFSAVHVIVRPDVEKEYLVVSNLGSLLRKLGHKVVRRAAPDTARRDVRFGGGNALEHCIGLHLAESVERENHIGGAVGGTAGTLWDFIEGVYKAGGGPFFDAFGHPLALSRTDTGAWRVPVSRDPVYVEGGMVMD